MVWGQAFQKLAGTLFTGAGVFFFVVFQSHGDERNVADDWLNQAVEAARTNDLATALTNFTKAIELDPDFAEAYNGRATEKLRQGDIQGALEDYDRAIKLEPTLAAVYYNRGTARQAAVDSQGAMDDYNQCITLRPGFAPAYNNRGELERAKGHLDAALADFNQAIKLNPQAAEPFNNRGLVKMDRGDLGGALADLSRAIELDPKNATAHANRGVVKRLAGDSDGAQADYDQAARLAPGPAETHQNPGVREQGETYPAGALTELNRADRLNVSDDAAGPPIPGPSLEPDAGNWDSTTNEPGKADESASASRASQYRRQAYLDLCARSWLLALTNLNRAIESDPGHAADYVSRASAKRASGDLTGAREDLDQAVKMDPGNVRALMLRGSLKAANCDFESALADASEAIELDPLSARAYAERGFIRADLGDNGGALADEEKAMELSPEFAGPYGTRGMLRYDARDFANALSDFRKFCQLDLAHSQDYIRFRIWLIEARLGEQMTATQELQLYLQKRHARSPDDWPLIIARFLTGELSEPELLHAAECPNIKTSDGRHCEAWFYAGSKRLINGDALSATADFNQCLAANSKNFTEYRSAKAELKFLQATNQGPPLAPAKIVREHPRRLNEVTGTIASPWAGYDRLIGSRIDQQWQAIVQGKNFAPTKVVAKFRVHEDGTVSGLKVSGDDVHAPYCEAAIMKCVPFPKWPEELQTAAALGFREMTYIFDFR
jgi:Tfp pilus assembly protein PilF